MTVRSGFWVGSSELSNWNLAREKSTLSEDSTQTQEISVEFTPAFSGKPLVAASLAGIHLSREFDTSVELEAAKVAPTGFVIKISAKGKCVLGGLRVTWTAFGN